jgi:hypothetical protein
VLRLASVLVALAACGGSDHSPLPPKKPNNELILGEFTRPPPATTAARFRADGSITVAHARDQLDVKPLAAGTYQLQGDQLTLTYQSGNMCPAGSSGTYKVVIAKVGIRFTKVNDDCADRSKMDGETWFRAK